MKQAFAHFTKKCREMYGRAYKPVPFAPYLPAFGRPLGLALIAEAGEGQVDGGETPSANVPEDETAPILGYQAVVVKDAPLKEIQQLLTSDSYGLSEKVNGERCLLVFDGERLTAYNHRGKRMSAPPAGATQLCHLGCPFVIDGERLTRDLAGHFVAFDLLEWNRKAYIGFAYISRMATLEDAMLKADLCISFDSTPTLASARANSTVDDLSLLVSVAGPEIAPRVIAAIQASSGEGIVVRRLEAGYAESPLKWNSSPISMHV
jgi:ATP-dependent DNA ligase